MNTLNKRLMNEYLKDQDLYFYFKKIFEPSSRHFSQVRKSRIFKNLKFRRKTNCYFRGNLIENHFRHLKAQRLEAFLMWAPFERQKVEVHNFDNVHFSGFVTWNFTNKQVFQIILRHIKTYTFLLILTKSVV